MGSTVTLHFAMAVLLFYGINWLGEHSGDYGYLNISLLARSDQAPAFNFLFKSLFPSAYILLVAAGFYSVGLDTFVSRIWLVAAYYFAFRWAYNVALGRALLLNWPLMAAQAIIGTGAAYFAYQHLILQRDSLLPDARTLGKQVWVILALFVMPLLIGSEFLLRRASAGRTATFGQGSKRFDVNSAF